MPNGNQRGSASDRRARKTWLLTTFGDGTTCVCSTCPTVLTISTIHVDRLIPAKFGGTYCRNNIRPHCKPCSDKQGTMIRLCSTLADYMLACVGQVLQAGTTSEVLPHG